MTDIVDVTFRRCSFRGLNGASHYYGGAGLHFEDCIFYGTRPGQMAAGVQDPTAVPSAAYQQAVSLEFGLYDATFDRCTFHFCYNGINGTAEPDQEKSGISDP